MPSTTLLQLGRRFLRPQFLPTLHHRTFTASPLRRYPRTNAQDKDSINTEATEYSKSGTDDGAAHQGEAAFDPSTTSPEQERKIAGKGTKKDGNPLDVSPANTDVSKQHKDGADKSQKEQNAGAKSGAGSGPKAG